MTVGTLIALAALLLEDDDLLTPCLLNHLCGDGGALDNRCADLRIIAIVEHQHRHDRQGAARLALELLDFDHVTIGNAILLPAGLNDCVHIPHPLCRGIRATRQRGRPNAECSSKNKANRSDFWRSVECGRTIRRQPRVSTIVQARKSAKNHTSRRVAGWLAGAVETLHPQRLRACPGYRL